MPKGPQGQKRSVDFLRNAVHVMRIAIGEIEDEMTWLGRIRRTQADGNARSEKLSEEKRAKIAKNASAARWR